MTERQGPAPLTDEQEKALEAMREAFPEGFMVFRKSGDISLALESGHDEVLICAHVLAYLHGKFLQNWKAKEDEGDLVIAKALPPGMKKPPMIR